MSDTYLSENDKDFAKRSIRESFPVRRYGSVFSAQCEAYSFLKGQKLEKKVTMRRVRALWEGQALRIDGEEKDALRRAEIEERKRERTDLRNRLSELDEALAFLDS